MVASRFAIYWFVWTPGLKRDLGGRLKQHSRMPGSRVQDSTVFFRRARGAYQSTNRSSPPKAAGLVA
jgi:hypothetical protein